MMAIPQGKLLMRTRPMPSDTNPEGDVLAGWLMSQMDASGAMLAYEIAQGRVATIAVTGITFFQPVRIGDIVCCYGQCVKIGNTSMQIKIEVWVHHLMGDGTYHLVTEAIFTFVAIDEQGVPRPVSHTIKEQIL